MRGQLPMSHLKMLRSGTVGNNSTNMIWIERSTTKPQPSVELRWAQSSWVLRTTCLNRPMEGMKETWSQQYAITRHHSWLKIKVTLRSLSKEERTMKTRRHRICSRWWEILSSNSNSWTNLTIILTVFQKWTMSIIKSVSIKSTTYPIQPWPTVELCQPLSDSTPRRTFG